MDISLHPALVAAEPLALGLVASACADGSVLVSMGGAPPVRCGILENAGSAILRGGDEVLVWRQGGPGERAIVIGRVCAPGAAVPGAEVESGDMGDSDGNGDELVIEARKSLTLRVGDGSITIREDGRILIKGKDLVSHAKGMNRIRGGSVSIN
jgi:hypothetical protein